MFYLEWLQRKERELKSRQQLAALDEIEREFENIRAAWEWAVQHRLWTWLRTSLEALAYFMSIHSQAHEPIALIQHVLDAIATAESSIEETTERAGLAGWAFTMQSYFFGVLSQWEHKVSCLERSRAAVHQHGTPYEIATHCQFSASTRTDPEEARALFEQALGIYRQMGATWNVAFVTDQLGHFAFGHGETLEAKRYHEEALALWRTSGQVLETSDELVNLGFVAYTLGEYDEGRRLLLESLAMQEAAGVRSTTLDCDCQEVLAEIAYGQGQFAEAEVHFRQQIAIQGNLGYREQLSWGLSRLGAAVLAQGRLGDAAGLLAEALAIAESCGDPRGIARAHKELGYLALKQGAHDTARRHWRTAIDIARRVQDRPHLLIMLDALLGLATLMAQADNVESAVELLTLVRRAASIDYHTATRAEQQLAELERRLSPAGFATAQARGRGLELAATVAAVVAEAPA